KGFYPFTEPPVLRVAATVGYTQKYRARKRTPCPALSPSRFLPVSGGFVSPGLFPGTGAAALSRQSIQILFRPPVF
ncbi:hypothetical protein, partial [Enterocloster asparagiformis]|uniref:hypothetical protein n=1 Tax=Enterocloster asparagiformis TaxID=333367 RepID=UPI002A7EE91A